MIFLAAFLIGILNNLPTGPSTAYLLAVRAEYNRWQSAIPLILGLLVADTILLYALMTFSERFHQLSGVHIASGFLSLILIGLGIHMLRMAKKYKADTNTNIKIPAASTHITVFFWSMIINLVNPSGVLSLALFLRVFRINPITPETFPVILTGYLLSAVITWASYVFVIHRMWHRWVKYTKSIMRVCGIALIVFGCSYILHRSIELLQRYIPEPAYEKYQHIIEKQKQFVNPQGN